jgi:hypothetical protein
LGAKNGASWNSIDPGVRKQSPLIESINKSLFDECLNEEPSESLAGAPRKLALWQYDLYRLSGEAKRAAARKASPSQGSLLGGSEDTTQ